MATATIASDTLRETQEYTFATAARRRGDVTAREAVDLIVNRHGGDPDVARQAVEAAYIEDDTDPSRGCDFYTLADLETYETPPDHILAGNGCLRRQAGTILTGGTGIGKSVLAAQISVCAAGGVKVLGCIPFHGAFSVLHLEAENDAETLQRDVCSLAKHTGADRDTVQDNLVIGHAYGYSGRSFIEWLDRVALRHMPDLIVVDPYQTFAGSVDINATRDFLEWIAPVQKLIRDYNAALLLVNHTPKPRDRDGWNARESVYMAAGTSAIANWARCSMELCCAGQETERFRLRFGKNAERTGLMDDSGRTVRELFLEHSGNVHEPFWRIADNQGEPNNSKYRDEILRLAVEHPSMTQREIAKELGCSVGTVNKHYPQEGV